jgi:hypothetical protein
MPSREMTMSPTCAPLAAAVLPSTTETICMPAADPTFAAAAGFSGTFAPAMPSQARRTRPMVRKGVDDGEGRRVERRGEAEPDAGDRGV